MKKLRPTQNSAPPGSVGQMMPSGRRPQFNPPKYRGGYRGDLHHQSRAGGLRSGRLAAVRAPIVEWQPISNSGSHVILTRQEGGLRPLHVVESRPCVERVSLCSAGLRTS